MINSEKIRSIVPKGLSEYTGVPVIRSNQDVPPSQQPPYPYIVYTVITLESQNNGTYGIYDDGVSRKPVTQTWSITALAKTDEESIELANKAKEWLEYVGTWYLNDNEVIVQHCSAITNRDNVLSVGYEYRNGFDAWFWGFSEITEPSYEGLIETVEIGEIKWDQIMTDEKLNSLLEDRLNGYDGEQGMNEYELNKLLRDRLAGDINNGR